MNTCDANLLINEDNDCEDAVKANKIKVANNLVKNYCLLKELNLLNVIKNEKKKENNETITKRSIDYSIPNIIDANKYIMDFLQLKEEQSAIKIKKEKLEEKEKDKKRKNKFNKDNILSEKDIKNIINILNTNESNLSLYTKNIMNCDKLNNFIGFNDILLIKHIDMSIIKEKNEYVDSKFYQFLKILIKNYNNSLNLIKIQQSVINDLIFYTHNLLMNNKMLIEKNENLNKNNSVVYVPNELNNKFYNNNGNNNNNNNNTNINEMKVPGIDSENISSLFKTQIDLYRKHINHLYNENNDLKKYLEIYKSEKK
ncbi:conserved protein, unknown function [Hepatocystis sp. ex Piliocolobus tephrosceles]|nr:conserved protein, unknown function [Hepatocystis sp. ex Piliocolobus tephrosceles]